jgi:hypothetical protein
MTVADRGTIDHIARSSGGDQITLLMVEDRQVDGPVDILDDTIAKINAYADFIASGQLYEQLPDAQQSTVRVQYNSLDDPATSGQLIKVLSMATEVFGKLGVEFVVRHLNLE